VAVVYYGNGNLGSIHSGSNANTSIQSLEQQYTSKSSKARRRGMRET
jgi:hypothetical protein